MAILNNDGTPYQLANGIQSFDPENPEFDLFNTWDQEALAMGGSPVYYYEIMIQTQNIHELYLEDRSKLWNPNPVCLMASFDPIPSQNQMTTFGMDDPSEIMFQFNYQEVLQKIGHPLRIGSRLFTAHRRENWRIVQVEAEEFKLWGQLRMQVIAEKWQESLTTGEGKIADFRKEPDFKINASSKLG